MVDHIVNNEIEMLALNVDKGTVVVRTDLNDALYILMETPASDINNWKLVSGDSVISVAGKTGVVLLGISDISGLTQAFNLKVDISVFETEMAKKADKI